MKKGLNAFVAVTALALLTASCNMGDKKDATMDTTVATDSSMMNTNTPANGAASGNTNATPPAPNGSTAMSNADSAANNASAVKPDPSKKGKKGKVSITMAEQTANANTEMMDKEGYYTNVYPSYEGGQNALANYFEKNIQYPAEAEDNGVEGTVNISFAVDEKGKISGAKTTNPPIGYGVEAEALRVFNKMPSWKPGSLKGKNVKTKYTLPVRFQLN